MKILTINAGSSSVKYALFENKKCIVKGLIERINLRQGCKNHKTAIRAILAELLKKNYVKNLKEIKAVGHRIVHGDKLRKTILLNNSNVKLLDSLVDLAPLHQPHGVKGIKICRKLLKCKHYAIFDTSFYRGLPDRAKYYAIPWKLSKRYEIERYGFHGTSHQYVYKEVCRITGKKIKRMITCHLGNGVSVSAILNGKAIDTSMGFTPLEGCMMGSRSGDIDVGIVPFLMKKEKISAGEIYKILNQESGLKGICGKRDMRDVLAGKDKKSKLALEMFCYRVSKYIGAYAASLGGIEVIVFTAGIGENSWRIRKKICDGLGFLGVKLDDSKNKKNKIQISNSKVKVFVVPTDEEKMMSQEVLKNFSMV